MSHLLEFLKYDDNVIVASYLYDVVKDAKYTIEDIRKEFSQNIASLVISTTKPYKVLSWQGTKNILLIKLKKKQTNNLYQ